MISAVFFSRPCLLCWHHCGIFQTLSNIGQPMRLLYPQLLHSSNLETLFGGIHLSSWKAAWLASPLQQGGQPVCLPQLCVLLFSCGMVCQFPGWRWALKGFDNPTWHLYQACLLQFFSCHRKICLPDSCCHHAFYRLPCYTLQKERASVFIWEALFWTFCVWVHMKTSSTTSNTWNILQYSTHTMVQDVPSLAGGKHTQYIRTEEGAWGYHDRCIGDQANSYRMCWLLDTSTENHRGL